MKKLIFFSLLFLLGCQEDKPKTICEHFLEQREDLLRSRDDYGRNSLQWTNNVDNQIKQTDSLILKYCK